MKKASARILSLLIFATLTTVTFGVNWFSFDIPHDTNTYTETFDVFTIDGKARADLGHHSAWTKLTVKYVASDPVAIKIGSSDSNRYPADMTQKALENSISYILTSPKEVSIFILYDEYGPYSGKFAYVDIEVKFEERINYNSTLFVIFLISFLTYVFLRSRNMGWINENRPMISQIEKIKAKRVYQSNHLWCDLCGGVFAGVTDVTKYPRYCSKTCVVIANQMLIKRSSYITIGLSLFFPIFIPIALFGGILSIYSYEMDGEDLKYTRYVALKQSGNIPNEAREVVKVVNAIPTKYIEVLDTEFLICCYQTARLDEIYCECGRSVPVNLRDYVRYEVLFSPDYLDEENSTNFQ